MRHVLRCLLFVVLVLAFVFDGTRAQGQQPQAPATPSSDGNAGSGPIPLAEVARRAEFSSASLRTIERNLAADHIADTIEASLPEIATQVDARLQEGAKVLSDFPSIESLRGIEVGYRQIIDNLRTSERNLSAKVGQLDAQIAGLAEQKAIWQQTLELAQNSTGTPPEVIQRINDASSAIDKTRTTI